MTLTLTDDFKRVFSSGNIEPRLLAIFELDTGDVKALDGIGDKATLPPSVAPVVIDSISPVSRETDPLTRKTQIGSVTMMIEQSFMRDLIVNERVKGKRCIIKLGARELAESDYVSFFTGIVENIIPIEDSMIRLEIEDAFSVLASHEINTFFVHLHPLQALKRILDKANVPAELIDAASLDPTEARYASISHFVINRAGVANLGGDTAVIATPAITVIDELSQILNGQFVVDEAGKLVFTLSDPTASIVATWDEDVIVDLKQTELVSNIINDAEVAFGGTGSIQGEFPHVYRRTDAASQTAHQITPTGNPREYTYLIESQWIKSGSFLADNIDATSTAPFDIIANLLSFCGMRDQCTTPDPSAKITSSRRLLVKIDDELITASGFVVTSISSCETRYVFDPEAVINFQAGPFPYRAQLSGITRGVLGTTAVPHTGSAGGVSKPVTDFTFPFFIVDKILERSANGMDIIEVTTLFSEFDKQVGELVKIVWPEFVSFGVDGLGPSNLIKFEIIGKEPNLDASPPTIKWILASAVVSTPATNPFSTILRISPKSNSINQGKSLQFQLTTVSAVINGLVVTSTGGLGISVSAGTAANNLVEFESTAAVVFTLEANKDSYIVADITAQSISVTPLALGSDSPFIFSNQVLLAKVVTDATVVVSIDDANVIKTTSAGKGRNIATQQNEDGSITANSGFGLFSKG